MKAIKLLTLLACISFGSVMTAESVTKKVCFNVEGMTCLLCPITVKTAIKKLNGVKSVQTSFDKQDAVVDYDPQLTNIFDIKKAIDDVGYKASEKQCKS